MTDRTNNDFAALLTPPPSRGVQFTQAKVLTWDTEFLSNTLDWRGITLTDVPMVEGINALTIRAGDVVGMLGWAPENAHGVGSWWILGKLSTPGEFIADLDITAKLIRFVTEQGYPLAFFGKNAEGDPLWILYYGDAGATPALRMIAGISLAAHYNDGDIAWRIQGDEGSQFFAINDESGNEVFATDAASQHGLSRPYLNYHMAPAFDTTVATNGPFWPSTTSTSYLEQYRGINTVWHPVVSLGVRAISTGGGAEWRFRVDHGTGFITVASGTGSTVTTFAIPGWGTEVFPGNIVTFSLDARNSGGTTWTTIDRIYGRQS